VSDLRWAWLAFAPVAEVGLLPSPVVVKGRHPNEITRNSRWINTVAQQLENQLQRQLPALRFESNADRYWAPSATVQSGFNLAAMTERVVHGHLQLSAPAERLPEVCGFCYHNRSYERLLLQFFDHGAFRDGRRGALAPEELRIQPPGASITRKVNIWRDFGASAIRSFDSRGSFRLILWSKYIVG